MRSIVFFSGLFLTNLCSADNFDKEISTVGIVGINLGKTSIEDVNKKYSIRDGSKNRICFNSKNVRGIEYTVILFSDTEMFTTRSGRHIVNMIQIESGSIYDNNCHTRQIKFTKGLENLLSVKKQEIVSLYNLTQGNNGRNFARSSCSQIKLSSTHPAYSYWKKRKECFLPPKFLPYLDMCRTLEIDFNEDEVYKIRIAVMESIC